MSKKHQEESLKLLIELKLSSFLMIKLLQLTKSDYAIPYLMNLTKDEKSLARYQVPETLRIIGSQKAKQALNELLNSDSCSQMRCLVIKALEEIGTDEVVEYLQNAIECPSKEVHLSAICALRKIGTSQAMLALQESLFYTEEIKNLAQQLLDELESKNHLKSLDLWKLEEKRQQNRSKTLANDRWHQLQTQLKKRNLKSHLNLFKKAIKDVFLDNQYESHQLNLIYQLGSTNNLTMVPILWQHLCQYRGKDEFLVNLTFNTITSLQNQSQDEQFSQMFGLSLQARAKLNRQKKLNPSNFNPPLPNKELERLEHKIKISFPQDYREFLLEFANGGWINCSKVLTLQNSLHISISLDSLFIPDLHMNQGHQTGILQIADLGDYHLHHPWLNQSDTLKTNYNDVPLAQITANYSMYSPYRLTFSQWCEEC